MAKVNFERRNEEESDSDLSLSVCSTNSLESNEELDVSSEVEEMENEPVRVQEESRKRRGLRWVKVDRDDISHLWPIENPCLEFEFVLDDFQKRACLRVEGFNSFFVSAHTSAGKTVCAEYAIASAIQNSKRAIYTSPIKALSNQKYREFSAKFASVGIITGDVSLNTEASVLIMTTEILRKMLYSGKDDIVSTVAWVIFDECHYINDADRGVVWEETIILLPKSARMVFLSATVPNYKAFCNWVGQIKQQPVYAIKTRFRPTPLTHYVWYAPARGYFQIMDNYGNFDEKVFRTIRNWISEKEKEKERLKALRQKEEKEKYDRKMEAKGKGKGKVKGKTVPKPVEQKMRKSDFMTYHQVQKLTMTEFLNFMRYLNENDFLPVTVFAFSRATCEELAGKALSSLDVLASKRDKARVQMFMNKSLSSLSQSDRKLPQILFITELIQRGVAVHHSGLLPIVKEIVELLFQQGVIKILIATETFAMGVNMPARSVVFYSLEKFDGGQKRYLKSSEYTQMAGRAGRRGKDVLGSVFIYIPMENKIPPTVDVMTMMTHRAQSLESKFRVNFQMCLQLVLRGSQNEEEGKSRNRAATKLLSQSFLESERSNILPGIERDIQRLQNLIETQDTIYCLHEDLEDLPLNQYLKDLRKLLKISQKLLLKIYDQPQMKKDAFCKGRLLSYDVTESLTRQQFKLPLTRDARLRKTEAFGVLQSIENCKREQDVVATIFSHNGKLEKLFLSEINFLYDRVVDNSFDLRIKNTEVCPVFVSKNQKLRNYYTNTNDVEFNFLADDFQQFYKNLTRNLCFSCSLENEHVRSRENLEILENELRKCREFKNEENMRLFPQIEAKMNLLNQLNYLKEDETGPTLSLKGKVGCEILNDDEITLSESLFRHVFENLTVEEMAALSSCFVVQRTTKQYELPNLDYLSEELQEAVRKVQTIHDEMWYLQLESGIQITELEWRQQVEFALLPVIWMWANGAEFSECVEKIQYDLQLDIQEGGLVQTIIRTEELLRKLATCANVFFRNQEVFEKFDLASQRIKRDIVFARSLYLST